MRYIVAVSGGIDSVVLLDLMSRTEKDLVVAHFDHGIREDSASDARFVEALADKYKIQFVCRREKLGSGASEELARQRRYEFLRGVAADFDGMIVTAHHRENIIETVAMNLTRGSRWRGLAGMSDSEIARPMNGWTKQRIYEYAIRQKLEWCEDETNQSDAYQRNRFRRRINCELDEYQKAGVYEVWRQQRKLRIEIEQELERFDDVVNSRYFLTMIDDNVAQELIYCHILRHYDVSLLGSQLERTLIAIKTGKPGSCWQIGGGIMMKLTMRDVIIDRV